MAEIIDGASESDWHLSDGVVTLRRPDPGDTAMHLAGVDAEQMRWMWLPGHRESWLAMTPPAQREHTERVLAAWRDSFGNGVVWNFAVDTAAHRYVAMVEINLAAPDVPTGEANISYSAHPQHRGAGHVTRALRLVLRFLCEQTSVTHAHLLIDPANTPSLRVATAVGAEHAGSFTNTNQQSMTRHVISIEHPSCAM